MLVLRGKLGFFVVVALVAAVLVPTVYLAPSVQAYPVCPAGAHSWRGMQWVPSSSHIAAGVESPIRLRTGAQMCDGDGDNTGSWIAFEPGAHNAITQIGFIKEVIATNTYQTCRFWAVGNGKPNEYACGGDPQGGSVWFRISMSDDGTAYNMYDCGQGGGYGICFIEHSTASVYTDAWVLIASETTHACQTYMLGAAATPINFGTSTFPVEEQFAVGGAWDSRPVSGLTSNQEGTACTDYQDTFSSTSLQTWDDRN